MKALLFPRIMVFVMVLVAVGCRGKDEPKQAAVLDSIALVAEYSKADIQAQTIQVLGESLGPLGNLLRFDVKCYKVTYRTTTTEGREVVASGAFVVPVGVSNAPLLSIQHGTLLNEADAPSYFRPGMENLLGLVMGSSGFYTGLPDYIGYGASRSEPHPYEHAEGLAVPVADFLLAVSEYLREEKAGWNEEVLLAGYSAGGYATLAAQKYIGEHLSREIQLKATSCGAGAYNKSLLLDTFIKEPTSGEVNHNRSYLWVLLTYNRIHQLNYPLDRLFKAPYAAEVEQNGHMASLSGSFTTFLQPDFIASYLSGNENALKEAFRANDLVDWRTLVPTLLVHGDQDTYVPYINATTALAGMKAAGSPSVTLQTLPGGTHETTIQEFIFRTYLQFATFIPA